MIKLNLIKGSKHKKNTMFKTNLQSTLKAGKLSYIHRKKMYKQIHTPLKLINKLYKSTSRQYNLSKLSLTKFNLNHLNLNSQILLLQHPIYSLIYYKYKLYNNITRNLSSFLLLSLF
nr:ribosomal protein L20 [Coccidia sp. AB-2023a]